MCDDGGPRKLAESLPFSHLAGGNCFHRQEYHQMLIQSLHLVGHNPAQLLIHGAAMRVFYFYSTVTSRSTHAPGLNAELPTRYT